MEKKYGVDPRLNVNVVSEPVDIPSGVVGELGSVGQLQAALDAAGSNCVVLKFEREGCAACENTKEKLNRLAARRQRSVHCFTVDTMLHTEFCKNLVGLKVVPAAHIYQNGELKQAMPIGGKTWPKFTAKLNELTPHRSWGVAALWSRVRSLVARPKASVNSAAAA